MVPTGKPRGSPTLKAVGGVTVNGRGGASRGGVDDHGTLEEGSPVTWEAPAGPRVLAGRRGTRAQAPDAPGVHGRTSGRLRTSARARGRPWARGTGVPADATGESEGCIRATTPGNGAATRTRPSKGSPCGYELQEGNMSQASTWVGMSPQLLKVEERAHNEPDGQFHALAHLLDESALFRAFHRQREDAAVGVDGITKEDYGQHLVDNLRELHERLKTKRYRHQPIRRVHIPKDDGKTRPLGISAFEDKIVQDALREVLQAVYEQDFLDCSYGFRPGRSAHDAIRALHRAADRGERSEE